MKFFKIIGKYECGEQKIQDIKTKAEYVACGRKTLFNEDYYSIERFDYAVDCKNEKDIDEVFKFNLMSDGSTLEVYIMEYAAASMVIEYFFMELLKGKARPKEMVRFIKDLMENMGD